jgi:hypothetical protein
VDADWQNNELRVGAMEPKPHSPSGSETSASTPDVVLPVVFTPPTWWRSFLIFGAIMFGGMAAMVPIIVVFDNEVKASPLGMGFVVVASAGFAIYTAFHAVKSPHYAFLISDEGFGETPRYPAGHLVPWREVARLRQRPHVQRLDMFSADGRLLGTLKYNIDHVGVAARLIADRVRQTPRAIPATFYPKPSWNVRAVRAAMPLIMAVGLWVWWSRGDWGGIAILVLCAGLSIADQVTIIRSATIAADGVTVRRLVDETHIPWGHVSSVTLEDTAAGAHTWINVRLLLSDGRKETILPEAHDVFTIYATAQRAFVSAASKP